MAWIEKRGKKWRVNWDIGTPENRERRVVSFDTPEEAGQYLKKVEYELSIGTFIDVTKMTVAEYFDHWIRLHGDKLAPMTLHSYQHQIRNHIKPGLGQHKLAKLSPMHLQDYYVKQLQEGRIEQLKRELLKVQGKKRDKIQKRLELIKTPGLSPTSVNYQHRLIHKALKQAVKWQMVARNIADAVEPPAKVKAHIDYLPKSQLNLFLGCINSSVDCFVITAAVMTGMRQGELLGLRWMDIDLDTGLLYVRQQLQYLPAKGFFFKPPKQHSIRTIPMPLPLNVIFRKIEKEQERMKKIYDDKYNELDLIFCNPDGSPMDGTALTKRFQALLIANNLPKIRFHSLRHTFATMARAAGVPLADIQDLLGHADISTTKSMYTHVEIEPLKKSIDLFTSYLSS
jgi:integrase